MISSASILLTPEGLITANAKVRERGEFKLAWDGFLYDKLGASEYGAADKILEACVSGRDANQIASDLRGNFFLAVWEGESKRGWACVDPNKHYSAYCSDHSVSRSYLELCEHDGITSNDIDIEALLEFLSLGYVHFGRTHTKRIRKISSDEIVYLDAFGLKVDVRVTPKIEDVPIYGSLNEAFEPIADALRSMSVSVELTGGFDSRLLACLLFQNGVPFEASIAAPEGHIDHRLGSEVAQVLKVPYHLHCWEETELEKSLDDIMLACDGLTGDLTTCHRLSQLSEERLGRGVEVALKGSAGELYKDFFWQQDFPFYWSPNSRIDRLVELRIEMERQSRKILCDEAHLAYVQYRQRQFERFRIYERDRNTQTYDAIYFHERMGTWGSRMMTMLQNQNICIAAPLGEIESVQIGYHAPRTDRFYSRLHRKYITEASSAASRVLTTDGTTASSMSSDLFLDFAGYSTGAMRKLLTKANQKYFNRTPALIDSAMKLSGLFDSKIAERALETLKEHEIVRADVNYADISPRFREFYVAAGWFLDRIDRSKTR